jgi:hypothetical protein
VCRSLLLTSAWLGLGTCGSGISGVLVQEFCLETDQQRPDAVFIVHDTFAANSYYSVMISSSQINIQISASESRSISSRAGDF